MKIFLSHSSKDVDYGNALVDLLISIGVRSEKIIFTSNDAHGIPNGKNIFQWLRKEIIEKPFVIYLLSPSYYRSVACLNEMGAAWIVENEHAMIFTPNFDLQSPYFFNGAIDPREIGFYIDNESRIFSFIDSLKIHFSISPKNAFINQRVKHFLSVIVNLNDKDHLKNEKQTSSELPITAIEIENSKEYSEYELEKITKNNSYHSRFFNDLKNEKLKDEEIVLVKYIIDRNQFKLLAGWQISEEIKRIRIWEDINEINDILSRSYESILRRFEVKNLIKVSALTSYDNPKEYELETDFANELIDSEELISELFEKISNNNKNEELPYF